MKYGQLMRDALQITWRHPFLWVLGLFAGGAAGMSHGDRGGAAAFANGLSEDVQPK